MKTVVVLLTSCEFDELYETYIKFNPIRKLDFKLRIAAKLLNQFQPYFKHLANNEICNEVNKQLSEIYNPMNFDILQIHAKYDVLTYRNLGPLNSLWLQELRNYIIE